MLRAALGKPFCPLEYSCPRQGNNSEKKMAKENADSLQFYQILIAACQVSHPHPPPA